MIAVIVALLLFFYVFLVAAASCCFPCFSVGVFGTAVVVDINVFLLLHVSLVLFFRRCCWRTGKKYLETETPINLHVICFSRRPNMSFANNYVLLMLVKRKQHCRTASKLLP